MEMHKVLCSKNKYLLIGIKIMSYPLQVNRANGRPMINYKQ